MSGLVVSLCDLTGNMVRPWAEAGYDCICYDLQHSIRAARHERRISYLWADVRSLVPQVVQQADIVFAFPPCTNLAVSGARDFQKKGIRGLIDALEVVEACRLLCEFSRRPWMLENPVSRLSSCWRKPDYTFDPADYGDGYTKKTCLWTGAGFVMPEKNRVEITAESYIHKMPPSAERANLRSATPKRDTDGIRTGSVRSQLETPHPSGRMKPRSPIPRIGKRKLEKLGGKIPFSTISKRSESPRTAKDKATDKGWTKKALPSVANQKQEPRTRIRPTNPARKKREFERAYHSADRVAFVKRLPCICATTKCVDSLCGCDNAHIETGGTGRKADYTSIVPLCRFHHGMLHDKGVNWFESTYGLDLEKCAAETESAWQSRIPERGA